MARYDEAKLAALMQDAGIVRNRLKIEASVDNARACLAIEEREPFADYLWRFTDGRPIQNTFRSMSEVPARTPVAEAMSKALQKQGFRFVGPTIVYAFMQAVGMVNDHLVGCHRHGPVSRLS
jgi:DNA-3-methyladenine glycosylase I